MLYGLTICDGDGCGANGTSVARRVLQFGTFDHPGETAGDALAAMTAAGWLVGGDGSTLCPPCAARGAATLPNGEALRRLVAIVKVFDPSAALEVTP